MDALLAPFLTDPDPQGAVKGSRDPLGMQSIWTRFGRHVVGNLTTVTSSVRDFTTLILGYYFAERVVEVSEPGTELATFLKWEQLAAYARGGVNGDWRLRGTERAKMNFEEGAVTLSDDPRNQILSNQKLYGIWGLYSMPGRASGLLQGQPARVTDSIRAFIEEVCVPQLSRAGGVDEKRITELLSRREVRLDLKRERRVFESVATALKQSFNAKERQFYRSHVLFGGPEDRTQGRQRQLVELLEPQVSNVEFDWTVPKVLALAKEAEVRGPEWTELGFRLRRIGTAERVLAPTAVLFGYMLGCDELPIREVANRLRRSDTWGASVTTVQVDAFGELQTEFAGGDVESGVRWHRIAQAMAEGDYEQLISLLVVQNRVVMQSRGGAAWIEEQNGQLRVRVAEETGSLVDRRKLETLWWSPYFLDSLCAVTYALKEARS